MDNLWRLPAAQVCDLLIRKGDALAATLHTLIGQCLAGDSVTLVEGEGIHPSLAPHHPGDLVRFGFVLEPEETVLFQTLAGLWPATPPDPQRAISSVSTASWM